MESATPVFPIEKSFTTPKASAGRAFNKLSDIIENYLKILTKKEQKEKPKKLNSIVKSLKGSFKIPIKDMDYKKELRNRLEEKYS